MLLVLTILFKADINIYVYRENLELLRNKKHVIENNRKTFEQLVAKKKQEGQTENELQKMRDEFEENPLKQDEQQTILEMEGKEKKLNKQQLKEKYAKLAHEKKALNNEYEAKQKHQAEQKASSLKEYKKLANISQQKEVLATYNRITKQEIQRRYERQLKSLQDELSQNLS